MPEVLLYTTRSCGYCLMAKRLLKEKGVAFEEIDVSHDVAKRRWLVETTGQRTVPQVFIAGKPYGGFREIATLDREGKLDPLLGLTG